LGVLISGSQTGSAVVATVSGGQAQVQFRGLGTSTTKQTATVTAEIVDQNGSKKSKSTTIELLPRIEVTATFPENSPPITWLSHPAIALTLDNESHWMARKTTTRQ